MELDNPTDRTLEESKPGSRSAPPPSYAPFLLALGITMLFWGMATSPVMSAGGLVLLVLALWMWISDIAKGWRN